MFFTGIKAQGPGGGPGGNRMSPSEMAENTVNDLVAEVTLTDDEQSSIQTIFEDFYTKMHEMRSAGTRPDRSKMSEMVTKRDEQVKEVLPAEKYEAYLKFMENRRRPSGGEGRPPRPE